MNRTTAHDRGRSGFLTRILLLACLGMLLAHGVAGAESARPSRTPRGGTKAAKKQVPVNLGGIIGPSGCFITPNGGNLSDVYYNNADTSTSPAVPPDVWRNGAVLAKYWGIYDHTWPTPPMQVPLGPSNTWSYYSDGYWWSGCDPNDPDPPSVSYEVRVTTDDDVAIKFSGFYLAGFPNFGVDTVRLIGGNGTIWTPPLPPCTSPMGMRMEVYYRNRGNPNNGRLLIEGRHPQDTTWWVWGGSWDGKTGQDLWIEYATSQFGTGTPVPNDDAVYEHENAIFHAPYMAGSTYGSPTTPWALWQESAKGSGFFGDCVSKCSNTATSTMTFGPATVTTDDGRRFRRQAQIFTNAKGYYESCWLSDDIPFGTLTVTPKTQALSVEGAFPITQAVDSDKPFEFYVNNTAGGKSPYYYQWSFVSTSDPNPNNFQPITGATQTTYGKTSASHSDEGTYKCNVKDSSSPQQQVTSTTSTLIVKDPQNCTGVRPLPP